MTAEVGGRDSRQAAGEEHLVAAAYLSRVAEPASVPLWMFVQHHGYPAAAAAVRSGDVPPEVSEAIWLRTGRAAVTSA